MHNTYSGPQTNKFIADERARVEAARAEAAKRPGHVADARVVPESGSAKNLADSIAREAYLKMWEAVDRNLALLPAEQQAPWNERLEGLKGRDNQEKVAALLPELKAEASPFREARLAEARKAGKHKRYVDTMKATAGEGSCGGDAVSRIEANRSGCFLGRPGS